MKGKNSGKSLSLIAPSESSKGLSARPSHEYYESDNVRRRRRCNGDSSCLRSDSPPLALHFLLLPSLLVFLCWEGSSRAGLAERKRLHVPNGRQRRQIRSYHYGFTICIMASNVNSLSSCKCARPKPTPCTIQRMPISRYENLE